MLTRDQRFHQAWCLLKWHLAEHYRVNAHLIDTEWYLERRRHRCGYRPDWADIKPLLKHWLQPLHVPYYGKTIDRRVLYRKTPWDAALVDYLDPRPDIDFDEPEEPYPDYHDEPDFPPLTKRQNQQIKRELARLAQQKARIARAFPHLTGAST